MSSGSNVVNIALKQKGISGTPNKFTRWMGVGGVAWCACFVSWCCNQAGVSTSISPKTAAVQGFLDFARKNGRFKEKNSGYKPVVGDIFIQKSSGASHTGFVISCSGNSFKTIEGNNGNAVKEQTHSLTEAKLTGFFHPAYTEESKSVSTSGTDTEAKKEKKDITKTVVKSINRFTNLYSLDTGESNVFCQLFIENDKIYSPVVVGDIEWTIERKNSPSKLKFTVLKDEIINFQEGNPVKLKINGENIFYGYIFTKSRTDKFTIDVTAYDQLRYFKNKDSYIYENKKYSELLKMIAEDYDLKVGDIADTEYVIPKRCDEGTLFDILGNAGDQTLIHTGKLYVLYDDFGRLTLKNIDDMLLNVYVDESQIQGYDYKTSIDTDVYNRVKLAKDNEETGEREFYIYNDGENQGKWGILQYYEKIDNNVADINLQAQALLKYYNVKSRTLKISNVFGNTAVRAGCSILVNMDLGDIEVSNKMVVEKVTHKFSDGSHFMDINLSGIRGEFNGE